MRGSVTASVCTQTQLRRFAMQCLRVGRAASRVVGEWRPWRRCERVRCGCTRGVGAGTGVQCRAVSFVTSRRRRQRWQAVAGAWIYGTRRGLHFPRNSPTFFSPR